MADSKRTVEGRTFQTKADYEAALRDKAKIDEIRKTVDFRNKKQVMELYSLMQMGQHKFESRVGMDFDDEIYDLAEKLKNQADTSAMIGKKKKVWSKSDYNTKKKRGTISLDDYDEKMQQEIITYIKKADLKRKLLIIVCGILAVGCLGYFGFYYLMADRTQSIYSNLADLKNKPSVAENIKVHLNGDEEAPDILEEYKTLYSKNKSLIGWVKIDDTVIDYPVMQSTSNDYYLDHNYDQEYDKNGSIFMDAACDVLKPSTNFIIYGHNMKSGKMFGTLSKYEDRDYYAKHPYINFDTIYEKGTYAIMYVFRSKIYYEDEVTFKYYQFTDADSKVEFDSDMKEMAEMSLYDTGLSADYGDQLITLSTCDYEEEDGRFVVVAKKLQ